MFGYEKESDTVYELTTMRSMSGLFMGKLITGLAFAYSMIWMPYFFKLIFCFISMSVLVPMIKDFWTKQLKTIRLTYDYLEIKRGLRNQTLRIDLDEIKKVELVDKLKRKHASHHGRRKSELSTVMFEREIKNSPTYPDSKCVITTSSGRRIEIESRYFMEGDFTSFLNALEETYQMKLPEEEQQQMLAEQHQLDQPSSGRMRILSEDEQKITRLIQQNEKYKSEDVEMKRGLEKKLVQMYEAIYKKNTYNDIAEMPKANILYEYRDDDESNVYIVDGNYLPNLDKESVDIGRNMIEATHKNLRLIETRISYYKKIDEKYKKIEFQYKTRRKLSNLRMDLEHIQAKNTNKSIDQNLDSPIDISDQELQDLENLSHRVHDLGDLEKAIMLNEHISLFRED